MRTRRVGLNYSITASYTAARANILLRYAPILAFAPFNLFVVDCSAEPLKCMGKTERISPQIFVDMSFNQDMAMRIIRFRQVTQCGKAWPKPRHLNSRNSPLLHEQCYKLTVPAMPERRRLNVNRAFQTSEANLSEFIKARSNAKPHLAPLT
jgi:hypothetical protein